MKALFIALMVFALAVFAGCQKTEAPADEEGSAGVSATIRVVEPPTADVAAVISVE